jgi:hypothetical protein
MQQKTMLVYTKYASNNNVDGRYIPLLSVVTTTSFTISRYVERKLSKKEIHEAINDHPLHICNNVHFYENKLITNTRMVSAIFIYAIAHMNIDKCIEA